MRAAFERFTERARQVVVLAQDEARLLRHSYIGSEHILLGLLREEEGLAARALESVGLTIDDARGCVERVIGRGAVMPSGQIPFTPRAKKVLESSMKEALALGHNYIGTEHILLGLLRIPTSAGAEVIADFAELDRVRDEVIAMLSGTHRLLLEQVNEYRPKSPPLAIEVLDELERRRHALEQAVEAGDSERASFAQERLDHLVRATRRLERAWFGEAPAVASARVGGFAAIPDAARASVVSLAPPRERLLLVGGLLFGSAATIGIVAGWLIWG